MAGLFGGGWKTTAFRQTLVLMGVRGLRIVKFEGRICSNGQFVASFSWASSPSLG